MSFFCKKIFCYTGKIKNFPNTSKNKIRIIGDKSLSQRDFNRVVRPLEKFGAKFKTKNGNYKGILLYFLVDNKPYYEYCPLTHTEADYIKWEQEMMKKHESDTWMENLYWYLDELSCVLVLRNKWWFNSIIDDISDVWDTILKERVSGYDHRLPKRRVNKSPLPSTTGEFEKGVCLIKLNDDMDNTQTMDDTSLETVNNNTDETNVIIKIKTS